VEPNSNQREQSSTTSGPVRVLIVQDHPLLAAAIREFLEAEPDMSVCGVVRTGREAIAVASREKPDVVLMDHWLPDLDGPGAAAVILTTLPQIAIVFHSADDSEEAMLDAIDAGATGYLTKAATAQDVVNAVRRAGKGEILIPTALFAKAVQRRRVGALQETARARLAARFTRRELEVLNLLAAGLDTTAIADRLGIADHTVEWHVRHLIEKLHVHSKLQAVVEAARQGLVEL
jgi:DNA-binding NarL/FixJ family response regulator